MNESNLSYAALDRIAASRSLMLPYLIAAIVVIGLPTIYFAVRYREYRKFLAGAFFVSSGMQFYFYCAKIPIPLIGTNAVQSPVLSGVRGTIHFVLFLVCLYFGWFFHRKPSGPGSDKSNRKPDPPG